jgi:hypothetical protein
VTVFYGTVSAIVLVLAGLSARVGGALFEALTVVLAFCAATLLGLALARYLRQRL